MKFIDEIFDNIYINFIKTGLTYDCTNPIKEKELLIDVDIYLKNNNGILLDFESNISSIYKLNGEEKLISYLFDLKNETKDRIIGVKGGRNSRYKIMLENFDEPLVIRTKDPNVKKSLDYLLKLN